MTILQSAFKIELNSREVVDPDQRGTLSYGIYVQPHVGVSMANKRRFQRRAKPGSRSSGRYFHIAVRPAREFVRFRIQDVGSRGGVQRLAGQRANGTWATQKWLIEKADAHIENSRLVPDSAAARKVLASLGAKPVRVTGDRFTAKPRRDIPEAEKPTMAMRKAQMRNIRKAQTAVRRRRSGRSRKAKMAR